MNILVETQPNCRASIRVEIAPADVARERERVTDSYARQAKLPGFRPGKAPKAVVAQRFADGIKQELEEALVRRGYQEALKRDDVDVLNVTGVREQSLHADDSYTFTLDVSTAPRFELPEYKGIPVKLPRIEVTDADIDHDLLHLREHHKSFNDVERGAAIGDFIVVHATGSIDGKPVEEVHPEAPAFLKKIDGNWLELTAEESFLPGFFAALQGIKKDESRDVNVTLGDDFPFEALRGQTVTMHVKCDAVKEPQIPALDEEFAKKINKDWTLEQLREEVRKGITRRREQSRENAKTNQVIAHLAEKLEFELPQDAVNREAQRRTNDIAMNAVRQGMAQEQVMEAQEQIVSMATQQARQNVKVGFILGEVAKKESITVGDEQIRRAVAQIAMQQRITPKKLVQQAQKTNMIERIREDLLLENAIEFLKTHAVVEDTEPEKDDCGHDHSH